MAKKTDPFDKFRQATLGGDNALSGALSGGAVQREARSADSPLPSSAPPCGQRRVPEAGSTEIRDGGQI